MADDISKQPPFDSLAFTLVEARGRSMVRLVRGEDDMYELTVQQGSGGNPKVDFTRQVPQARVQALKDALQEAGVFGWQEEYGDLPGFGMLKWNLSVVFKREVYTFAARGGNDVPAGFDTMMEQFYQLDLPRPEDGAAPRWRHEGVGAAGGFAGLPSGMPDFSRMAQQLGDMPSFAWEEMREVFEEFQRDPASLQRRMREEFSHMSPSEQESLIDELTATGIAPRTFWETFLRGE